MKAFIHKHRWEGVWTGHIVIKGAEWELIVIPWVSSWDEAMQFVGKVFRERTNV